LFYRDYAHSVPIGTRPRQHFIDGDTNNQSDADLDDISEASLDLQYGIALTYPQKVQVLLVGDKIEGDYTSFNNFLDALDKSYCTSGGGDDPEL